MLRQVASNITKEAMTVKKRSQGESGSVVLQEKLQMKAVADSKRIMAENIAKTVKIWHSFTKFIKS